MKSELCSRWIEVPVSSSDITWASRSLNLLPKGTSFLPCFEAVAKRELEFCRHHAKPRLHVERYLRELHGLRKKLPSTHAELLSDYLKLAPLLDLSAASRFSRPVLRHPDFSPSNILVNDANEITGIIDWQHAVALPLCLCAGIPKHFQNWGDPVSERLANPAVRLPENFDSLPANEQNLVRETMRKQIVHFYYGALAMKRMKDHFDALRDENAMLRAKLFDRAGAPWEGDSLSLEHTIVQVLSKWPMQLEGSSTNETVGSPVYYSPERIKRCMEEFGQEEEKLQELDEMKEILGTDNTGWIKDDEHLERATEIRDTIKKGLLDQCTSELERTAVRNHFPFDDHDEDS